MSKYLAEMRELDIKSGEPVLRCWFLLNGDTHACVKERGHDAGVHEGPSELHCGDEDRAHQPHVWTKKHQCAGAG